MRVDYVDGSVVGYKRVCVCVSCNCVGGFEGSSCWVSWPSHTVHWEHQSQTHTHTHTELSVPEQHSSFFPSRLDRQIYTHIHTLLQQMGRLGGSESSCPWNQTDDSANARRRFCFWGQKTQRESSCRLFHQRVIRAPQLKVFGRRILYACCYCPSWDGWGIWDCKSCLFPSCNAALWIYSGSEGVPRHLQGLIMVKSL